MPVLSFGEPGQQEGHVPRLSRTPAHSPTCGSAVQRWTQSHAGGGAVLCNCMLFAMARTASNGAQQRGLPKFAALGGCMRAPWQQWWLRWLRGMLLYAAVAGVLQRTSNQASAGTAASVPAHHNRHHLESFLASDISMASTTSSTTTTVTTRLQVPRDHMGVEIRAPRLGSVGEGSAGGATLGGPHAACQLEEAHQCSGCLQGGGHMCSAVAVEASTITAITWQHLRDWSATRQSQRHAACAAGRWAYAQLWCWRRPMAVAVAFQATTVGQQPMHCL